MIEQTNSAETREHRLKRLRMRSMRRGIKEMDILLSAFADANLDGMAEARLDLYDRLLHENDHGLRGRFLLRRCSRSWFATSRKPINNYNKPA